MKRLVLIGAILTAGCSNPNAPSDTGNHTLMEIWANQHRFEDCIKATRFDAATGRYIDYGVLVPKPAPSGTVTMPISFCNPAE